MASSLVEIETVRAKRRNKLQTNSAFANFERVIEGWYWVLKGTGAQARPNKAINGYGS